MYGVELKCIGDLFNNQYIIPDYQRGYRWREEQAELLLNDLLRFYKSNPGTEIYLLQPLVVNRKNDNGDVKYVVIDGQQRLTTIKLILCAFKKIFSDISKYIVDLNKVYSLKYDVRPQTEDVIENPDCITDPKSNIDYFHIHKVYDCVKKWLEKNIDDDCDSFMRVFLNNVCFIDYEISGDKKAEIELFTRLNVGKIPLTEAELIKALFLNKKNYVDKNDRVQYKISNEWNDIENRFQNDEFWYFIHNADYDSPTRIDYLFEIIYSLDIYDLKSDTASLKKKDVFPIFNYFKKVFDKGDKTVEAIWEDVRDYYLVFEEWYADYEIYHHVGYIIATTGSDKGFIDRYHLMNSLVNDWKSQQTKDAFKRRLEDYIADILRQGRESWLNKWDDQVFEGKNEDDGNKIGKTQCNDLLLLHNIETVIKQNDDLANSRKYNLPVSNHFPFHLYKLEKWETEHIYPNAGDKIKDLETQKAVLFESRKLLATDDKDDENADLKKRIDAYLNRTKEFKDEFEDLYAKVLDKVDSNYSDKEKNKISNYTLLDKTTNGEYGNLIFKIKRAYIMNKEKGIKAKYRPDKDGKNIEAYDQVNEIAFVLPVTKNVFAKFYTPNPGSLNAWTGEDAECYLGDMRSKIGAFVNKAVNRINTEVKSLVSK